MNISKSIINYAAKYNIGIDANNEALIGETDGGDVYVKAVWFHVINEDGEWSDEPLFSYSINKGQAAMPEMFGEPEQIEIPAHLSFYSAENVSREIQEELPGTINSDSQLKEVIKFIAAEMKAGNIE
ncbi:hypothetical protein CKY10_21810 [Photorhabdus sp. HUG-39]|uniref:Uncharacterized protein n=1 Tax=Photorhabdus kayaii TaxID=230088 RepID=A0ABX0B7V1_9GAMM|nr:MULTISPECIES: hypothetical protein [Photorhabdus]MCC8375584.1 hypothetical protein [Photorhabdus bodei]MDB6366711.1 hypothetical protein [Photorhabdus bodei]NDL14298.1 hypothetical protein [Photorhabdus kayaii]NDL27823.1 hypothetical protein [Photorhabdus kayaii]RAX06663.1 hypothetical protein CKY10_21810 [Photorhabdus sp. HUG-39]